MIPIHGYYVTQRGGRVSDSKCLGVRKKVVPYKVIKYRRTMALKGVVTIV